MQLIFADWTSSFRVAISWSKGRSGNSGCFDAIVWRRFNKSEGIRRDDYPEGWFRERRQNMRSNVSPIPGQLMVH